MQQAVSLMLTGIWMLVLINESARMTALPFAENTHRDEQCEVYYYCPDDYYCHGERS